MCQTAEIPTPESHRWRYYPDFHEAWLYDYENKPLAIVHVILDEEGQEGVVLEGRLLGLRKQALDWSIVFDSDATPAEALRRMEEEASRFSVLTRGLSAASDAAAPGEPFKRPAARDGEAWRFA